LLTLCVDKSRVECGRLPRLDSVFLLFSTAAANCKHLFYCVESKVFCRDVPIVRSFAFPLAVMYHSCCLASAALRSTSSAAAWFPGEPYDSLQQRLELRNAARRGAVNGAMSAFIEKIRLLD
jgi:hypothetical protein